MAIILPLMWAAVVTILWTLPDDAYPRTRLSPVIPLRYTGIGRVTYLALLYGALSAVQLAGWGPAWAYFGMLWLVPLFTTFPLFMILRQWVQHGNADRGRYTNTRVFLVGPLVRYAVFPFGMDYHLPHHLMASVPHYNLKRLHEIMLRDPEYREKGVIVEGYFGDEDNARRPPDGHGRAGPRACAEDARSGLRRQRRDRICRRRRRGRHRARGRSLTAPRLTATSSRSNRFGPRDQSRGSPSCGLSAATPVMHAMSRALTAIASP